MFHAETILLILDNPNKYYHKVFQPRTEIDLEAINPMTNLFFLVYEGMGHVL
jgi:hypothetical protein